MIRCILLDIFGTLITPRRPVHLQYTDIARAHGLHVKEEDVRRGFRTAYKHHLLQYPLYGKQAGLNPKRWWTLVIEQTFREAGCSESKLQASMPSLGPALVNQFWSDKGYMLTPDVMDFLQAWQQMPDRPKLGCVSNSDPRITQVLESLDVVPRYIQASSIITSWHAEASKPNRQIFDVAYSQLCQSDGISRAECLMVGDDVREDVEGATMAQMQAALLIRDGQGPAHDNLTTFDRSEGVTVIKSLSEIVKLLN